VQQVHRVAALLAGKDIGHVYSSDLFRAMQTATVIAEATAAAIVADGRLRERGFGRREGAPTATLDSAETGIRDGRITDIRCHPDGGESLDHLYRRCRSFTARIDAEGPGRDLVVVAHGGSIRMLRAAWAGTGPDRLAWTPVGNAAVFRLVRPVPQAPDRTVTPPYDVVPASSSTPLRPLEPFQSSVPLSPAGPPVVTRPPSTVGRPS
jgi:broad specificity phosphatase PhoE